MVGLTWLVFGLVVLVDVLIDDRYIWRVNVDAGRNLENKPRSEPYMASDPYSPKHMMKIQLNV